MTARSLITTGLAACLLAASAPSSDASEDHDRRATIPSNAARRIAGDLFPEKCGSSGERCGITYDDRRGCPFEFVVVFPATTDEAVKQPPLAWVTVDNRGAVVEVSSNKKGACRNATS